MSTYLEDRAKLFDTIVLSNAPKFKELGQSELRQSLAAAYTELAGFLNPHPAEWMTFDNKLTIAEEQARRGVLSRNVGPLVLRYIEREMEMTPEQFVDATASEPREKFLKLLADIAEVVQA